ncbi:MAG TPA: hypothetical protein VLS48_07895, partial [Anaerolineales bacterium]|nr:hypothetical protein [Anaerolineales bacterium]
IQEYYKDLLPEYLSFVQGVVDSEDLPLNVSRESVQANRIVATLKKLVTGKVIDMLKNLASEDSETYAKFWQVYDRHIKQGVAIEQNDPEKLYPLLRFHTTQSPDAWSSLDDYISRLAPGQDEIYYILGDDVRSTAYSPHLDLFRQRDYEVLFLTDPVDAFMLVRLNKYRDYELKNVAQAEIELPAPEEENGESPARVTEAEAESLVERFKNQLGERVSAVRLTERLTDSPARLVDPEGAMNQEMQRVYRLLNREYDAPVKTLELNPRHPLILGLNKLETGDERSALLIEQIYENALLIEGLHPDPAGLIGRIQRIMQAALEDESETN